MPETIKPPGSGITVDKFGSGAIDPTENVKSLVAVRAEFQKEKDALVARYRDNEAAWHVKYFEALAKAEQRRLYDVSRSEKDKVDVLAAEKTHYEKQISDSNAAQLKAMSDIMSSQVEKVASSLAQTTEKTAQNISILLQELGKRLIPLEEFRFTMGGKTSVSDPAMQQIANELAQLKLTVSRTTGNAEGEIERALLVFQKQSIQHGANQNWIAIVAAIIALAALLYVAFARQPEAPRQRADGTYTMR